MAKAYSRSDAVSDLKTSDDIAAYLNASAAGGDPATMVIALGNVARTRNVSQLARELGMSREGFYKALSPNGNPAFATVVKVACAMGFDVAFRPRQTS